MVYKIVESKEAMLVPLLYRWKIEEYRKRAERKLENELYVTDLIYCPLKVRFSKIYQELALGTVFEPRALIGDFIHKGIERTLAEILGEANVKSEVEYEKDIVVDGTTFIVKGRIDVILGDTVVEIKSSRSDISLPHPHHVQQLRIYLWLTGMKRGLLLYVTDERLAEFFVEDPASDGEVSDLIRSVLTGRPAPRYSWECRYCPFSSVCSSKITSER